MPTNKPATIAMSDITAGFRRRGDLGRDRSAYHLPPARGLGGDELDLAELCLQRRLLLVKAGQLRLETAFRADVDA